MNTPNHVNTGVFARMDGEEWPEMEPYIDCNGRTCWRPKGEGERMRYENRLRRLQEIQAHAAALRAEKERR